MKICENILDEMRKKAIKTITFLNNLSKLN